jgi:GT2 family glycosyltransferase
MNDLGPKLRPASSFKTADSERRVRVVVVTYNSEPLLDRFFYGLAEAGPCCCLSVTVVDNDSRDNSAKVSEAHGASVRRFSENRGFAAAVNAAALDVDEPYILLLNPDAIPKPGAIDRLIDAAEAHPESPCFCCRTFYEDGTLNPTSVWGAITPHSALMRALGLSALFKRSNFANPEALPRWERDSDRDVDVATGCALLLSTHLWKASGGFDERYWMYGEETEWQMRLRKTGFGRPRLVAAAECIHLKGAEIADDTESIQRRLMILRARATIMRCAWPSYQAIFAPCILNLEALRHGAMALLGGPVAQRHLPIWRTRKDWMAGYPPVPAGGGTSDNETN